VKVSVVLPVFKNREMLPELHRRLVAALSGAGLAPFEILFVDDACPEHSGLTARAIAREDRRVRVVALVDHAGQQRAVMAGLALARGEWVVTMDADLQDPPEVVPRLIAAATPEIDAVFAGRRGRYESAGRLLTSKLFKRALHLVTGLPIDAGMFVAMRRTLVRRLLAMPVRRPFVVAMIGGSGARVLSIPVVRATRPVGASAYNSRARLALGARALWCAVTCRRRPAGSTAFDYQRLVDRAASVGLADD
jgi:polyisoprenyl-phosphate glycosyltransferase